MKELFISSNIQKDCRESIIDSVIDWGLTKNIEYMHETSTIKLYLELIDDNWLIKFKWTLYNKNKFQSIFLFKETTYNNNQVK